MLGAGYLIAVDTLARTLAAVEIPLGVLNAFAIGFLLRFISDLYHKTHVMHHHQAHLSLILHRHDVFQSVPFYDIFWQDILALTDHHFKIVSNVLRA